MGSACCISDHASGDVRSTRASSSDLYVCPSACPCASSNGIYTTANYILNGRHTARDDNLYAANLHAAIDIGCYHGRIPDGDNTRCDYIDSGNTHSHNDYTDHYDAKQDDYSQCEDLNKEEIQEEVHEKEVWMLLRSVR